jgi:riboflavin synthase
VGDEVGGHLVSGHVACLASVRAVEPSPAGDGNVTLRLATPCRWGRYLLPKGFVALDGVSLTLGADVCQPQGQPQEQRQRAGAGAATSFAVHLIPETLRATTLGRLSPGASLNLEVDAATQAVVDAVDAAVGARLEAALRARGL